MKKYEFFEHASEIKFRAYGRTIERAFENTALAISDILSRGDKVEPAGVKKIEIEGENNESLLYDFIDELIYLLDAEHFIVAKAIVKIQGKKLEAKVFGDDALKYPGMDSIKAATYSEMHVKQNKDGNWEVQIVVDV
ncbi:archease [Candidatus Pacearchaeota archaeon CG_4_9_14_0_2_um_filter_39_13]|nr:archease [Candidatus Pacearchaeota archaeon]OIO43692.1 MAG: hypothetical protein AUJ64_01895 [Candidatus Pacearchaeota archaeon CG1_02_39_14]PJC44229.1 MAG: archease [Candidatus Pacearchaeota archaeon CG_4_9_14_0_2_um_filter_39_13]